VASVSTKEESMGEHRKALDEFNAAFNAHDAVRMRACYADDAKFTSPGGVSLEGPEAITEYAMTWLRAFPDGKATVTNEIITGDWAVIQQTFTGTHTETLVSPDGDIPATNKSAVGRAAEVLRFVDGKIVEDHLYFDQMEIFAQLGLIPETATA
jgi:steroid delta-isomerase-like uncharacterized protein